MKNSNEFLQIFVVDEMELDKGRYFIFPQACVGFGKVR